MSKRKMKPVTIGNTKAEFMRFRRAILKERIFTAKEYDFLSAVIPSVFELWDPNKTYCGPDDTGDALVPDLWFRFAGYFHDALCLMVEKDLFPYTVTLDKANKVFSVICHESGPGIIGKVSASVYSFFVNTFSRFFVKRGSK